MGRPPASHPLAAGLLRNDPGLFPDIFPAPWNLLASFRARLGKVGPSLGPEERVRAAEAMHPTSGRAAERIHRFVREGGAVVTTGQQAGFLTGPLYTVSKALTAARLAARLEEELGCVVLPVFWIASDDHDFAEIRTAWLGGDGTPPLGVTLPAGGAGEGDGSIPMAERELPAAIRKSIDEVAHTIAGEEFAPRVLEWIEREYRPGGTVARSFRDLVAELFSPLDLVLTDAAHPVVRAASRTVFRTEIRDATDIVADVAGWSRRLEDRCGAPVQVPVLPDGLNLFLRTRAGRERIFLSRGGGVVTRESGFRITIDELLDIVERTPERVSPNVLLRPVVEAAVFAPLAYVAGPAEMAYLAQTAPLFGRNGVSRPIVYPRASFTLIEPSVRRALDALGLDLPDLDEPESRLWDRIARARHASGLDARGVRLRRAISDAYQRFLAGDEGPPITDDARGRVGSLRDRAIGGAHRAERAVLRAVKAGATADRERLDRILAALRPHNSPQERVLNVMPFIARHGPSLVERMAEAIDIPFADSTRSSPPGSGPAGPS